MSGKTNKPTGYVNAVHIFGRSMMGRLGQTRHLQWQWRNDSTPFQTVPLTKEQYNHIKTLLGPVVEEQKARFTEYANSIHIYHEQTSKHYMRVLRYLKKEGLLNVME